MSTNDWLHADELVIPFLMILAGVASIGFQSLLKSYAEKQASLVLRHSNAHHSMGRLTERFTARRRVSWLLMAVGSLWLLQTFVSSAIAGV